MANFIEFQIKGSAHLVNIDNIAMIKQVDQNTLEIHLLSKDENNAQINFKINYPYGDVKFKIQELGRMAYDVPFTTK